MKRLPDWEARLAAYLDCVRYEPFAYGRHDCALHSANAVMAMTGEDFAAEFRGRYRSAAGSIRALRQYGAGDLASTITAKFGEPIPTAFAQRGDLVMTEGSVGVCMGGFGYFAGEEGGEPGLVVVARRAWEAAWRVPHG